VDQGVPEISVSLKDQVAHRGVEDVLEQRSVRRAEPGSVLVVELAQAGQDVMKGDVAQLEQRCCRGGGDVVGEEDVNGVQRAGRGRQGSLDCTLRMR
jgi:hypothetical protein